MPIKFYLQADKLFNGDLKVNKYYEFKTGQSRVNSNGILVDLDCTSDFVDEAIIAQHKEDYEKFEKILSENPSLFELAKLAPEKRIDPESVIAEAKEKEPKPKSKKEIE